MVSFVQQGGFIRRPKLRRLMAVQEEIYRQLMLLIPDAISSSDWLVSRVSGSPPLYLQVLERHRYTDFLRLTYAFNEDGHEIHNPNAHIRLYYDARIAEVTSYSWGQGIRRFASPYLPPRNVLIRNWRLNQALDKWLTYLLGQGHSLETMHPEEPEKLRDLRFPEPLTVA